MVGLPALVIQGGSWASSTSTVTGGGSSYELSECSPIAPPPICPAAGEHPSGAMAAQHGALSLQNTSQPPQAQCQQKQALRCQNLVLFCFNVSLCPAVEVPVAVKCTRYLYTVYFCFVTSLWSQAGFTLFQTTPACHFAHTCYTCKSCCLLKHMDEAALRPQITVPSLSAPVLR